MTQLVMGALASKPFVTTMAWRHHFARVEGVRLHWAELGESTANPPLVLLHGLSDCYRTWRQIAPEFARDRRVLAPDLPGHGLSARPDASYELPWYAHVMARWLETAGVDRADVVGHSFGGGVAQMMLLECAQRIRRLVLVSSGGSVARSPCTCAWRPYRSSWSAWGSRSWVRVLGSR